MIYSTLSLVLLNLPWQLGLHTGTRVPIGTEICFEKYQYFSVSLRTGTWRHRFVFKHCIVFEHRFISTNKTNRYLRHHAWLIQWRIVSHSRQKFSRQRQKLTLSWIAFGRKYDRLSWRSFASINFVNVRHHCWFCSPILLIILVKELRHRTTM